MNKSMKLLIQTLRKKTRKQAIWGVKVFRGKNILKNCLYIENTYTLLKHAKFSKHIKQGIFFSE